MKYILTLAIILILSGCTDKENAKKILEIEGYKNISFTGYSFFSCSRDDFYSTGFAATKNNQSVEGAVCSGLLFKNSTIRYK